MENKKQFEEQHEREINRQLNELEIEEDD